ncbi:MAG: H-type lectin domain-containing protein, partial [Albidovulum sp.]
MQRIASHLIGVDRGSVMLFSDYQDGGAMWTGEGPRELRRVVEFAEPFRSSPVVQVSISMWDMDRHTNQRAYISA